LASLKIRQAVEVLDKLSPVKHVAVDEPRHVSF